MTHTLDYIKEARIETAVEIRVTKRFDLNLRQKKVSHHKENEENRAVVAAGEQ